MAFHVGVSGHRHLPETDASDLRQAAASLFRAIREAVLELHAADQAQATALYQPAPPRLRCLCGLAEGADAILAEAALDEGWDLVAVLPFDPDEFAADFSGPALGHYRNLLARASSVCSLDGDRETGTAYADIGEVVVGQSDLLLAVWDRLPARGRGGTGEVVGLALGRGLPVAILPPSGPCEPAWLGGDTGDVASILRAALLPPQGNDGFPHAYFADKSRGAGLPQAAVRTYERLLMVGSSQPAFIPVPPGTAPPPSEALDPAFLPADRLATEYAARYRAVGLMRYGLILPATLASLVGWYGVGWHQAAGNLAAFVVLVFIVRFSAPAWWEPSHRRFIAYRALAEYLRNARMLAALGEVARMPGAAAHQEKAADWTAWYGRAVVRQQGLSPACFDQRMVEQAGVFVRGEAAGQVQFLLRRAARFDVMARRLTQIGVALSICGIAFAGVRAAMLLAGAGPPLLRGFNEMALVLPAMAPVFLGLLSFNEYSRLATRYRAVAAELRVQIAALDRAPPRRAAVLPIARRIAEVMLAETADWQLIIKARTVSAY
jgi:hypothetical protein